VDVIPRCLVVAVAALVVSACAGGSRDAARALDELSSGWTTLPGPPEVRNGAANAWTGTELLTWGGGVFDGSFLPVKANGWVYDAALKRWSALPESPLGPRSYAASAWTGEELLVWGGTEGREEQFFADGAAYDPDAATWRRLRDAPIGARAPLSVWTGDELLVWGSRRVEPRPRDGAAYDPATDTWRTIATAPIELTDATAVWTGREMIVFGAALHGGNFPETETAIAAAYEPTSDTWRRLPDSTLSPQASTAAWVGRELVAWDYLSGTAAFHPGQGKWRQLPDVPLDSGECSPESVPVAESVFGEYCGQLAVYDASTDRWRDIAGLDYIGWSFELVPAGDVVLLLGRNADTDREQMLAYRPEGA